MQSRETITVNALLKACYTAFAACAVFSFFVNLLMLTMPLFMFQVFDRVLASRSETTLFLLLLMATLALSVQAALDTVRSFAFVRISRWIDRRIGPLLLSSLVMDALDRSKATNTNSLRSLATIRTFLTGPGMLTILDLPWTPVFLILIFYMNAPMGIAAIGGALLMLVLGILNDRLTRPALAAAQTYSTKAYQAADAAVRNAAVVESMGMRRQILRRYHTENEQVLSLQSTASDRAAFFLAVSKSARMLVQMVIMSVAAVQIIDPTTPLTPGMMIAVVLILGRALQPIEMGVSQARSMIEALQAYRMVEAGLKSAQQDTDRMSLPAPRGDLSVENLYYQPPNVTKPILQRITFEIGAGESVGVIGPSAAGKSTLARLLVGVEKPSLGHVRLDGADVYSWDAEELGAHIGFMPQDIELFPGTVAQNIGRLEQEPDPQKVIKAAKLAGMHAMILRLPDGYDTEIGWAGQILSGGQRQRIALARALYGDPKIVVLDEPNANLDSQGDEALNTAIRVLKSQGSTLVLITHRPQTLSLVDKVLILQNGMVQRFGSRDEMVSFLNGRRDPTSDPEQVTGPTPQPSAGPSSADQGVKGTPRQVGEGRFGKPVDRVASSSFAASRGASPSLEASMTPSETFAQDTSEDQNAEIERERPIASESPVSSTSNPETTDGYDADKTVAPIEPDGATDAPDQSAADQPGSQSQRRSTGRGAVVRPPGPSKRKAGTLNVENVGAISATRHDE